MNVLWVDDDSPSDPQRIGDAAVITAQSISSAERLLQEDSVQPDWVVVDLIIPQAGWGDRWLMAPGIEFVRKLSERSHRPKLAVYSIALTKDRIQRARDAGASLVVDKHDASFFELVEEMRARSGAIEEGVQRD